MLNTLGFQVKIQKHNALSSMSALDVKYLKILKRKGKHRLLGVPSQKRQDAGAGGSDSLRGAPSAQRRRDAETHTDDPSPHPRL